LQKAVASNIRATAMSIVNFFRTVLVGGMALLLGYLTNVISLIEMFTYIGIGMLIVILMLFFFYPSKK
jgi:hypothetical protein